VTTTSPTVLGAGVFCGGAFAAAGMAGAGCVGWASCAQVAEGAIEGAAATMSRERSRIRKAYVLFMITPVGRDGLMIYDTSVL
jgi:hypothetical protein